MSKIHKITSSRNSWKSKAIARGKTVRYLERESKRIKQERNQLKKTIKIEKNKTTEQLKNISEQLEKTKEQLEECKKSIAKFSDKESIVYLALQLFLDASISFRACSRVLEILQPYLQLALVPTAQTINNWVVQLSIARIRMVPILANRFIFIMDESIGLGGEKIFALIAINAKHFYQNSSAPTLQTIQCVAVAVASSWTGETISNLLQEVIAITGPPIAFIKDGGSNLFKALKLLNEQNISCVSIDDISHIVANILKRKYKNHPKFDTFLSACGKVSKNVKQTILACIAPPKVSIKSIFMNIRKFIDWADKLLNHSPRGAAAEDSILKKLRESLDNLPECKAFIRHFLRDATVLSKCQTILKNNGLTEDNIEECMILLKQIPPSSSVRKEFETFLNKHIGIAKDLGLEKIGLPITSDCIESLFGVAKQHGTGNTKDANRIGLRLPAFCGKLTKEDAKMVLNITVTERQKVEATFSSLTKQRRKILSQQGSIEQLKDDALKQNLKLIPTSEKCAKNNGEVRISSNCAKNNGPKINLPEDDLAVSKIKNCNLVA